MRCFVDNDYVASFTAWLDVFVCGFQTCHCRPIVQCNCLMCPLFATDWRRLFVSHFTVKTRVAYVRVGIVVTPSVGTHMEYFLGVFIAHVSCQGTNRSAFRCSWKGETGSGWSSGKDCSSFFICCRGQGSTSRCR